MIILIYAFDKRCKVWEFSSWESILSSLSYANEMLKIKIFISTYGENIHVRVTNEMPTLP